MPNPISLKMPPGMARLGTVYESRGRWFDGNLVRWYEGVLQPIGGWSRMAVSVPAPAEMVLPGPVRGLVAWRDNSQTPVLAAGTPSALHLYRGGALYDITPADLAPGRASATPVADTGKYGSSAYGAGAYGEGLPGPEKLEEATTWALDTFGQQLVACSSTDGRILTVPDPAAPTVAPVLAGAPTGCCGVVVTPERFIVALGASGDGRTVAWTNQDDIATWPSAAPVVGQEGNFTLTTPGSIMAARRGSQETLIWTDVDLWRMGFVGGVFVYGFRQVASNCGAASRQAMAVADGKAYWMGTKGFFTYDGFAKPLDCEVADFVFGSLNEKQRSKIACYLRGQYGEVTWHYPSGASSECDRYVTYNYRGNFWLTGALQRTAGVDSAVFGFPIAADASGRLYKHEITHGEYQAADGTMMEPYIESGPVELGDGGQVMDIHYIIPDANTLGAVTASIYSSIQPVTAETLHGPYPLSAPTPARITGRQVRLRIDGVFTDWRVGTMKLDVSPGSRR